MSSGTPTDHAAFLALARTTALHHRDYRAWHRGRTHYAVWIIDFDEPDILTPLQSARAHFADLFYQPSARQLPVTVFVSGFWVDRSQWEDDYTPAQCRAQQDRLHHLALPAFDITLGAIKSFASALYVEVQDSAQGLATVRQALQEVMPELRWTPYVPHVTLGVYRVEMATHRVVQRIQDFACHPPLSKRVTQVKLMTYAAQELLGPLHTLYVHTFGAEGVSERKGQKSG
jgi:hypothetical protein